ncbi:hypothetical protein BXT84_10000 [Sulfobacillus thermotolerans]|uniref:EamA domain-containing protein n=1 Tax=Sulfobacillus thermotolerans TaxID=338644 RepID=A0ABM6RW61_9FIRM|nr:hypothetical protein BXT84_10000 [Sulfobacillus thermotolerans]
MPYITAFVSIVLSSLAQVLLKLLMRDHILSFGLLTQPLFYAGFLAYGLSAILWLQVLAKLPLVVAYPLVSLNFVFVAMAGAWVLHERISWHMILGLGLIIGGIVVITSA